MVRTEPNSSKQERKIVLNPLRSKTCQFEAVCYTFIFLSIYSDCIIAPFFRVQLLPYSSRHHRPLPRSLRGRRQQEEGGAVNSGAMRCHRSSRPWFPLNRGKEEEKEKTLKERNVRVWNELMTSLRPSQTSTQPHHPLDRQPISWWPWPRM